jgi:hypothetical protein
MVEDNNLPPHLRGGQPSRRVLDRTGMMLAFALVGSARREIS